MLWSVCRIASSLQHLTASFDSFARTPSRLITSFANPALCVYIDAAFICYFPPAWRSAIRPISHQRRVPQALTPDQEYINPP
jgi:hypothetical protein